MLDGKYQPDLVLINKIDKKVVIHDITSQFDPKHFEKGQGYVDFFEREYPGYDVEYSEAYWSNVRGQWEALGTSGELYHP